MSAERGVSTENMGCSQSMCDVHGVCRCPQSVRCPQNVQVSTECVGCPRSTCGVHGVCRCPQSTWGVHRACGCPRSVRVPTECAGVHGVCGVSTKCMGCPWSMQVSTERGESSEHWPPCPFILPAESLCPTLPAWGQDRPATPPHGTQCLRPPVSVRRGAFPCTWAWLQPQGTTTHCVRVVLQPREPKNSAKHTRSLDEDTSRPAHAPPSLWPRLAGTPAALRAPGAATNHPPAVLLQNF